MMRRVATVALGLIAGELLLVIVTGASVGRAAFALRLLLLGVFLLGLLTKRASQNGAIAGMLCGLALNVYIWHWTQIAWTWYVTIGACATFAVGYLASLVLPAGQQQAQELARSEGQ